MTFVPPHDWTTPRCIHHWATHTPNAPALIEAVTVLSYRDLGATIIRFARALSASSIRSGMLVGIETDNRTIHMALIQAAGLVGATSISLSGAELALDDPILRRCDLLCLQHAPPRSAEESAKGVLMLTDDSLRRILSQPVSPEDLNGLADERARPWAHRLLKTWGTTGRPKIMASTEAMALAQRRETELPDDSGLAWNYLTIYNFTFRGAQRETDFALRRGATTVLTDIAGLPAAMERFDECRVSLMPGDVVGFVNAIPATWHTKRRAVVAVKGGPMPAELRRTLSTRVATHVEHHYASNETHTLALIDADGIARIRPETSIRIVDADGTPVPDGQIGVIEARTPYMVDGYLWDDAATKAAFRDGWYYTNDLARMVGPKAMILLGRADDMIVVGGIKIPPQPLEQRIRDLPGVDDAVLLAAPGPGGGDQLFLVIESDSPDISEAIRTGVATIVTPYYGGTVVILRRTLPRTEHGKIRRSDVRDALINGTW